MSIAHLLEDFGMASTPFGGSQPAASDDTELLESFEQGYKAGWDDALRAKSEERASITADFARNLHDLSFTYHEARNAVMADIAPVIEQAVMTVLPELSRKSLGAQVVEELKAIAQDNSDTQVLIATAPENYEAVSVLLPNDVTFPVDVVRDAGLGAGQVRFQCGNTERQIDLDEVLSVVSRAFQGFTYEAIKETRIA